MNVSAYLGSSNNKARVMAQLPAREPDVRYRRILGIDAMIPMIADALSDVLGDDVQRQVHEAIAPGARLSRVAYVFLAGLLSDEQLDGEQGEVFGRCAAIVRDVASGAAKESEAKQAAELAERIAERAIAWNPATLRRAQADRLTLLCAAEAARAARYSQDLAHEGSMSAARHAAEAVRVAGEAARYRAMSETYELPEIEARVRQCYEDMTGQLVRAIYQVETA